MIHIVREIKTIRTIKIYLDNCREYERENVREKEMMFLRKDRDNEQRYEIATRPKFLD